jgi:hypothetical protein
VNETQTEIISAKVSVVKEKRKRRLLLCQEQSAPILKQVAPVFTFVALPSVLVYSRIRYFNQNLERYRTGELKPVGVIVIAQNVAPEMIATGQNYRKSRYESIRSA